MPTLEWIGKDKVINHHQEVPYRVLEHQYSFDQNGIHNEDINSGNMIIHGDNLEALKSLLPRYENKIKCIYIDPPYNTGNEGWVYNDNVNDPKIGKWLGDVVGKEGEDLSRHDKWLCMMYPRLKLLRKILSYDGVIFISIDDNELFNLKLVCDEIFGRLNYISTITRPTGTHTGVVNKAIVGASDYILVYAKNINLVGIDGLPMTEKDIKIYDQEDEYGKFLIRPLRRTGGENRREDRPNMFFPLEAPDGTMVYPIGPTGYESRWICNPEGYAYFLSQNRILWKMVKEGDKYKWQVYQKFYLEDKKRAVSNLWNDVEGNKKATRDVRDILSDLDKPFDFPKPVELIEKILTIANDENCIVLDSFAGSGTTAHAVLNLNKRDGGKRKFILIEMEEYAETVTAERIKRIINGYGDEKNKIEGTGGNFNYYELGKPLFLPNGDLNRDIEIHKVREYIWFMETKKVIQEIENTDNAYYLGKNDETAYYFYYDNEQATTLDHKFLTTISTLADNYIIYADLCTISEKELQKHNITFKKVPRDITKL